MAKLLNGDYKKSAKANDGEAKKVIRLDDAEMEGIAGGVAGGYDPRYNVANPIIPVTNGGPDTNVALIQAGAVRVEAPWLGFTASVHV